MTSARAAASLAAARRRSAAGRRGPRSRRPDGRRAAALQVDLELEQLRAAAQEVAAVGAGVEADDVVGEHPPVDLLAHADRAGSARRRAGTTGCGRSGGGRRPGAGADHRRRRVEVVVVEHHERLLEALDLAQDGGGDVGVDRLVAVLPGVDLLPADVRGVGEVPEVVLDEPEDRVGDHVVEAVVGVRVGLDQQHAVARSRRSRARPARRRARRDRDVLVGHRRGDPERVAVRDQPREGGHEAAAAAAHGALAVLVARTGPGPRLETMTSCGSASGTAAHAQRRGLPRSEPRTRGTAAASRAGAAG